MKISRHKKVHRYLSFFCNNFGFRQPYQVLIDGTFCFAALKVDSTDYLVKLWNTLTAKQAFGTCMGSGGTHIYPIILTNKFNIKEQIPKYFDGDVKLLTTPCVIIETESLGHSIYGALIIVKQFATHRCGHNKPVPGAICLESMLGANNPNRYIIATQDREFQALVRRIPGTPLLYLHQKAPTLEHPSATSSRMAKINSHEKFGVSKSEGDTLAELKKKKLGLNEPMEENKKRKKRKRGPNPLSCKKKTATTGKEKLTVIQNKKKRKRIKVSKHVKEHWELLAQEEVMKK